MALGKNLKKRKLIENESDTAQKKPVSKRKKSPKAPKELIGKPKAKKPAKAAPKKAVKKKDLVPAKPQEEKQSKVDSGLPIFIAKELHELKASLRKRYKDDVDQLSGRIIQFVILEIGSESYAVDIDCVKEVVPVSNLSKTPNTPAHIEGIANVRGSTYVVFDLAMKFKLDVETNSAYLLVLENDGIAAALSLNLLPTTKKVNGSNISSELHMIEDASLDVSYIKGLIQHEGQLIYYLDIIELLKNDKAIVVPDELLN